MADGWEGAGGCASVGRCMLGWATLTSLHKLGSRGAQRGWMATCQRASTPQFHCKSITLQPSHTILHIPIYVHNLKVTQDLFLWLEATLEHLVYHERAGLFQFFYFLKHH